MLIGVTVCATPVRFSFIDQYGSNVTRSITLTPMPNVNPATSGTNLIFIAALTTNVPGTLVVNLLPVTYLMTIQGSLTKVYLFVYPTNTVVDAPTITTNIFNLTNVNSQFVFINDTRVLSLLNDTNRFLGSITYATNSTYASNLVNGAFIGLTAGVVGTSTSMQIQGNGVEFIKWDDAAGPGGVGGLTFGGDTFFNNSSNHFNGDVTTDLSFYGDGSHLTGISSGGVVIPGQSITITTNSGPAYKVSVTGTLTNATTGNAATATKSTYVSDVSTNKLDWGNVTNQPAIQTQWPVSAVTNAGTAAYSNSSAFYLNSNPSNYITSNSVPTVGTAAYSNTSAFYLNSNPSNYVTSNSVPLVGTAAYSNSSAFYLSSNPSNYLTSPLQGDLNANGFSLTNALGVASTAGFTNSPTAATAFNLAADSTRVPTVPVAVFQPTKTNSGMVIDIFPSASDGNTVSNGFDGSLSTKFDLVDRNPNTSANSSLWNAFLIGINPTHATIGTHSSGNLNPVPITFWGPNVGQAFSFVTTSSNETSQVAIGDMTGNGVFEWGNGPYLQFYQTLGVFLKDYGLQVHDNDQVRWYDSRSGLQNYLGGVMGVTNGALAVGYVKITDGGTGLGDLVLKSATASTTVSATNGYWFPTNAISSWPTAAQAPGWAFWGNSNGAQYQLISAPGSTAWVKTNLIGTVP